MRSLRIPKNFCEYVSAYPTPVQKKLEELRTVILSAAPGAEEKISYQMPSFYLKGVLVYFAAYKDHIGFYPTPSGVDAFKNELKEYKFSKGAIRFPIDRPIPFDLVTRIVVFRVKENLKITS